MSRCHRLLAPVVAYLLLVFPAAAERRVALVVGNSAYVNASPLPNPVNDAGDMAKALTEVGFEVILGLDLKRPAFDGKVRDFARALEKADVALFFYAGHGLQATGKNYLVPVDASLQVERDLDFEAVSVDFVLKQMELEREGKTNVVFLDACRDNPLARNLARSMGTRSAAIGKGLAQVQTGVGTFIAYSTQPGNVALDGQGRNSPFTAALVKHMTTKGRNLPATMIEVRKEVVAATGGAQVPWDHSALTGDFFFAPGAASPAPPGAVASAPVGTSADVAALRERLRKLEEEAKRRKAAVAPVAPPTTGAVPPVTPRPAIAKVSPNFQIVENVRIEGLKISDQREPNPAACRDACENENGCVGFQHGRRSPVMGQCQLFSRIDARHEDASWRSGVRTDAALPSDASLPRAAPKQLAVKIGVPLSRKEKGFDIYEGISIMGDQIKMSATDSSAGCQVVCRNTPGCFAATYNEFFRGKNVACIVYRDVTNTMLAPTSTLMIRSN